MKHLAYLLLSVIFIHGGLKEFRHPEDNVKQAAEAGVPEPELAVKINGATRIAGGAMLGLGIRPKLAAAVLFLSLIPTTIIDHPFWKAKTEAGRHEHRTHAAKNLGLMGGLLLVMLDNKHKAKQNNS